MESAQVSSSSHDSRLLQEEVEERPEIAVVAKKPRSSLLAAAVGNFSVQYNFQTIAIALTIAGRTSATPQRDWVNEQCKSIVFIGCILGQISMGYIGDVIGRGAALRMTLFLSAAGALASAVLPWGDATTIYVMIVAARFVIGFGVGGVYPLSATSASESTEEDEAGRAEATARAADAFFWQTPGYMAPYLVALILRGSMQSNDQSFQWRLLLGLGALPASLVLLLKQPPKTEDKKGAAKQTNTALRTSLGQASTWRRLAGTGGAWFVYDVAFYGFTLSGPAIVATCFKRDESIMDKAWQQMVALSFAIPGVLATTALIRRGNQPKALQSLGFYIIALAYIAFALLRRLNPSGWVLYLAYLVLNFALNFGPNVTTFVLPSATRFPVETRATFNGASSALGKLGAVVGTELLPYVFNTHGLDALLFLSSAVAIAGALLTHCFVERVLQDDDRPQPVPTNDLPAPLV